MHAKSLQKRCTTNNVYLSSYRIMWAIVIFDLPVVRKEDRQAAAKFRSNLLDLGFSMVQFSVYFKLLSSPEELESISNKIKRILPGKGKVEIIYITDKQYENIISYYGSSPQQHKNKAEQLWLF